MHPDFAISKYAVFSHPLASTLGSRSEVRTRRLPSGCAAKSKPAAWAPSCANRHLPWEFQTFRPRSLSVGARQKSGRNGDAPVPAPETSEPGLRLSCRNEPVKSFPDTLNVAGSSLHFTAEGARVLATSGAASGSLNWSQAISCPALPTARSLQPEAELDEILDPGAGRERLNRDSPRHGCVRRQVRRRQPSGLQTSRRRPSVATRRAISFRFVKSNQFLTQFRVRRDQAALQWTY